LSASVQARGPAYEQEVELLACESCGGTDRDVRGFTRGQRLLEQLRALPVQGVRVVGTRCLWNCQRSCSLHVRSAGRAGYVLADLQPSAEMARALLDWTALYAASHDGAVPFKSWPQLMRGHFLCRIPASETRSSEGTDP
jgi:predicted metal-binding protein